jgi:hypothetical protein
MSGAHRALPTTKILEAYPCEREVWLKLHAIGKAMVSAGASADVVPLRAFQHQRYRAAKRGIAWNLTLADWWSIWDQSGHWHERGLGRSYMMCRVGDNGAYEVGNVYIGPGAENLSAGAKKCDLPIGVARRANKARPYRAYCNIAGKQRHLGVFATVEEARAAYLAALAFDTVLSRAAA